MPYVTSIERLAKAEGGATVLLKPLTKLCGPLPGGMEEEIHRLSIEQLAMLGEALLDFRSLQNLESWLAANDIAGQ